MTRAPQVLNISQPAVSRLIAYLDETLGFLLLERRDGRLVPEQEVRFVMADMKRLLELLESISDAGRSIIPCKAGDLWITCLPGFAVNDLHGFLTSFLRNRPDVTVTLGTRQARAHSGTGGRRAA